MKIIQTQITINDILLRIGEAMKHNPKYKKDFKDMLEVQMMSRGFESMIDELNLENRMLKIELQELKDKIELIKFERKEIEATYNRHINELEEINERLKRGL